MCRARTCGAPVAADGSGHVAEQATTASYLEDRLVFLPFDHPQFHRPLGAIRRTNAKSSPIEDRFLKVLKQKIARDQHL